MKFAKARYGQAQAYTLDFLTQLLRDARVMTLPQSQDIIANQRVLRQKVLKIRYGAQAREKDKSADVSPAELIAAAELTTPDGRILQEDMIMEEMAKATGYDYLKIDPLKLDERLITNTLSRPFASRHVCLPIERLEDKKIVFAVDNPFHPDLVESLRSYVPSGFVLKIASRTDIRRLIREIYGFRNAVKAAELDLDLSVDISNLEQLVQLQDAEELEATDQHIVKAVDYLLRYAFEQKASDIHLEPKRSMAQVRLRIDGLLHQVYHFPRVVHLAVVSRIKMLARMDIAERRRPQAGRIKTEWEQQETELRVSTLPVAFGEKVVIRVFDPKQLFQEAEQLGFSEVGLRHYTHFIEQKTGLILVTGPTGSGKTTTLYSTLKRLASPEVSITTIEDPIEMIYEDFNQTMVQPKVGITFASALRTILRQDPDIIMVGEIRDTETAQMAVQSALTGHLMFSTLHTNDAASAITRLQDLGVPHFLLSSVLVGIINQRLLRKVCEECKSLKLLHESDALSLGIHLGPSDPALSTWYGQGCPTCRNTGLKGRTGVFEILPVDNRIRALIHKQADAQTIRSEARANGMETLREDAIRKLAEGITSFEEVLRLMGEQ
ncbi:MAG: type II secretion system protein E [Deltaproteobacteria bacterium]|nr:type II secretion system protein E [Deltaproteobacteria bacterium]MBU53544.1 type II secretion system protein E [Deltaproteobacteria bacterium]|tara:strand:- start:471 stop:2294 length:1824 start_codon:yes stop_codon:yes gene_type:complete